MPRTLRHHLVAACLALLASACTTFPDDVCMAMLDGPHLEFSAAPAGCPAIAPRTGRAVHRDYYGSIDQYSYGSVDGCPDGSACTLFMEVEVHQLFDHSGSCGFDYTEKAPGGALVCTWDYLGGGSCTWTGTAAGRACGYQFSVH